MRYFLLTLSALCIFAACNKKPKVNPSMENMLRTGKWKLSSAKVTVRKPNGKDTTLDYLKFIPDCYKDDYLVFDSLHSGKRYTSSNKCSPADPEYFTFNWQFKGANNSLMDIYNGYNYVYGIVDTVQPFHLNMLGDNPLVYDTVLGTLDTAYPPKQAIELDTIRELRFSGVPAGSGSIGPALGGFNITDANVIDFSQSSFTLHFQMISYYNDSTGFHGASILLPLDHGADPDVNPGDYQIIKPDTFNYMFTYSNY